MSVKKHTTRKTYLRHVQGGPKIVTIVLYALTLANINRFQNCFTVRFRRKFV